MHAVCYLDLLGYGQLVDDVSHDRKTVQQIEEVFRQVFDMPERMKQREVSNTLSKLNVEAARRTTWRVFSDSVVASLDLSSPPEISKESSESDRCKYCLGSFLSLVEFCYLLIASRKLGYFFRGGLSIGQYHEAQLAGPHQTFLFSAALVDAARLEREAETPRILISDRVFQFLEQKGVMDKTLDGHFFTDEFDGKSKTCLDVYYPLIVMKDNESSARWLNDIVQSVRLQVQSVKQGGMTEEERKKTLRKYRWFADYHNRKIKESGLSVPTITELENG